MNSNELKRILFAILSLVVIGGVLFLPSQPIESGGPVPTNPPGSSTPAPVVTPVPSTPNPTVEPGGGQEFDGFSDSFEDGFAFNAVSVAGGLQNPTADPPQLVPVGWSQWHKSLNYENQYSRATFEYAFTNSGVAVPGQAWLAFEEKYNVDVVGGVTPEYAQNGRPEYTRACNDESCGGQHDPRRVYEGTSAAQFFCFLRTCEGGYYRTLTVEPGATCVLSAQFQGTTFFGTETSDEKLTITPYLAVLEGDNAPLRGSDVITEELFIWRQGEPNKWTDKYTELSIEFTAPTDGRVTIVIGGRNNYPVQGNFYFDNVEVRCPK